MNEKKKELGLLDLTVDELLQEINRRAAIDYPDCKHDWVVYSYLPRGIKKCVLCGAGEYEQSN